MGALTAGEVVLVPFPFSDLSATKVRPALCLAMVGRSDYILCQITSQTYGDPNATALADADFSHGGLLVASFARPGKLFTGHRSLVYRSLGHLNDPALQHVLQAVVQLLQPSTP